MKIIVAPDSFKGSLSAGEAVAAIGEYRPLIFKGKMLCGRPCSCTRIR
ncbi:MAG: hypothetical protein JW913_08665 [Chitinispirillaceae bacterium]|nr:hypothetical protein [Chitinispirillaceae bacterium]